MENVVYLRTQRDTEYIAGDNCDRIEEHGDGWSYDVYDKAEGIVIRVFDPVEIRFEWLGDE